MSNAPSRPCEQVGAVEGDAAIETEARGIGARDFQRVGGNFRGVNFGLRQLGGERQRNTAGAGADVDDSWLRDVQANLEHGFDQVLGFRARDQDSRADDEVQSPEFLVAGDVLRGNAASALLEGFVVASLFVGRKFALGMGVEIGAIAAEDEHQQDFGVHARRADLVFLEHS